MVSVSVCIDVSDMKKGIEFYTKALGFKIVNEGEEHSELTVDGIKVYLIEKPPGSIPCLITTQPETMADTGRLFIWIFLSMILIPMFQKSSISVEPKSKKSVVIGVRLHFVQTLLAMVFV